MTKKISNDQTQEESPNVKSFGKKLEKLPIFELDKVNGTFSLNALISLQNKVNFSGK